MSGNTQKPGEKPDQPGPKIEVNRKTGKPITPSHKEVSQPGAGHLPPTTKPGHGWKPLKKNE